MNHLIELPDDVFKYHIMNYLTRYDVVSLDNACLCHEYRPRLLDKLSDVILMGGMDSRWSLKVLKWLGQRKIFLQNVTINNLYDGTYRCTRNKRKTISDITSLIKHCTVLTIIDKNMIDTDIECLCHKYNLNQLTRITLRYCENLTDASIVLISEHCKELQAFHIYHNRSNNFNMALPLLLHRCTKLKSLSLIDISDKVLPINTMTAITQHCKGLQSLNFSLSFDLLDSNIILIVEHCTGLQSLNLSFCSSITHASLTAIGQHCKGLRSLDISYCSKLNEQCILSLLEHLTSLNSFNLFGIKISNKALQLLSRHCSIIN